MNGAPMLRYRRVMASQSQAFGGCGFDQLRDGMGLATLNRIAGALSDTDAAKRMQQAKATLFHQLRPTG